MFIMKKLFKYIAVLAASVMAFGCYPEVLTPDAGQIPSASDFDVEITVDNETNYVTFTMKNEGVVPMWIFGDQNVDKTPNTRFAYTQNGITLRFREAGEHKVEVKAYNAHGVSQGSQIYTFTLDNTYRDPFDPTPYLKAAAGEWMWNSEVAGHFGCGETPDNPTGWWSCGANEKADWSLYNDRMTFTADGKYAFNPGEDGKVYVNKDFTGFGGSAQEADYLVDIAAYETTYTFENNWNAAGIEEIYLVLPANTNLSYIPNNDAYANPRFLVVDSKPAAMKKELKLVMTTPGISWYYNFVPAVKVIGPGELLAGTSAEGKVWVMASEEKGHLGCGSKADNPTEWWAAGAEEKKDAGMYDNELTFFPDGTYKFDSGEDGSIYANKCVTALGVTGATADYVAPYEDLVSTYEFDGETLTFPAGATIGYIPNDNTYNEPVFTVAEITATRLVLVSFSTSSDNPDGIAWQYIFKARDVQEEPVPEGPVVAPFDPAADENMWKNAAMTVTYWFANSGWGQIADPVATIGDNEYTFVIPEEVGGSEWQGQVVFRNTGLVLSPDKTYDFRAVLSSTADGTATIKPCYEHPTELDGNGNPADVNELFYDNSIAVTAYEELEYVKAGLQGTDIPDLKLVIDLGRFPAGTTVTVSGIVIRESKTVDNGPVVLDPASDANMWKNAAEDISFWFANDGWSQIANPELTKGENEYTIVVPEGTGAGQWQGQMVFNHTGLVLTTDKKYDFQVTFMSSEDHPHVTIKPCYQHPTELDGNGNPADVNEVLYVNDIVLTAYEEYVYTATGLQGTDIPDLKLVFDFGGAVAGSEIVISGITIQEHQE